MDGKKAIPRSRIALADAVSDAQGGFVPKTAMWSDVIRVIFISVFCLALSPSTEAADRGQLGPTSPEVRAWANTLENKLGQGCCSTADGWKPQDVEYDMKDNKYRVKIE